MNARHTNRLAAESSLYLQQHGHNPVDWFPWGTEALEKARLENKLIFLSVGYSACHWCHVMERESFEDETIGSILRQHFVSIKVDREERPDIDAIYMESVQMMTGHGGWPLNVWLTPTLEPIYGGTYFPVESSHNRPGFQVVLERLSEMYRNDPDKIAERASEIKKTLEEDIFKHIQPTALRLTTLREAVETSEKNFDPTLGGFSPAPKFPAAMNIEFLLRYHHITGDEKARDMALFSLEKMCLGGIYDQIGGGFHRYSTDPQWLVPHFEKMLYDNALLLSALCDAWQVSKNSLFSDSIHQTIEFIRRELQSPSSGFYAALDADSEGHEGTFYIWSHNELSACISKDEFPTFAAYYSVYPEGNWEGSIILNRVKSSLDFSILSQLNHDTFTKTVNRWNSQLLKVRSHRVRPACDTKIITSWNAMMLRSLCKVWFLFPADDLRHMIVQNATFLCDKMIDGTSVFRIAHGDEVNIAGFCDDYALLSEALAMVFQVTGDPKWLHSAETIAESMIDKFYDTQVRAFYYTESNQPDVLVRKKDVFDNATPSANSAAIASLLKISRLTGKTIFSTISAQSLDALGSILGTHAMAFGYALNAASELLSTNKGEIVFSGGEPLNYVNVLAEKYLPFYMPILADATQNYTWSTLQGKNPPEVGTKVYICHNFSCDSPVLSLEEFATRLHILPKSP